jgi:hypothetical protein
MIKKYRRKESDKEFIPKYPEKYMGRYPIVARSSWEYRLCQWLDLNPTIYEWSSEGHCISYLDPFTTKSRRYYPDFFVRTKNRKFIVEIKPEKFTKMPISDSKSSEKTINTRKQTYYLNQAKFKAAKEYCKKMGFEFLILTEKQLFRDKRG